MGNVIKLVKRKYKDDEPIQNLLSLIENDFVKVENLIQRLNSITERNVETRIYIRGDRVVAYGRIMEIMSMINTAGYIKVALIAQNPVKK